MSWLTVTRVQHTCVIVKTRAGTLAIDPALDYFNAMWSPGGDGVQASRLLRETTAVLVTHAHSDHFHPPTLLHFPPGIPIVIPKADATSPMPMVDELRRLGFEHVHELGYASEVLLGDLTVTAIETPASVEGIAQTSYLISDGVHRVLHTADSLEGFLTEDVLPELRGVDVALLPMNVSLNVANLRNQMSPATFSAAAARLEAQHVVPLGTNEGERRAPNPTHAPWFPYGDAHLRSPGFQSTASGVPLVMLADGDSLTLGSRPDQSSPLGVGDAGTHDSPEVDHVVGRLLTLMFDVHRRSRAAFGLAVDLPFDEWCDRWCGVVDALEDLLASASSCVDGYLSRIPVSDSITPAARIYRRSLERAELRHPGTHARVLWGLERGTTERDFAQATYDLLVREASDERDGWTVLLEYLAFLQRQHHASRPQPPAGWTEELQRIWWARQIREDLQAAEQLYPRFNPIFGPFRRQGQLTFVSTTFKAGWRLNSHRVPDALASSVVAVAAADGRQPLQKLIDADQVDPLNYERMATWLAEREPYALDDHWLPGAGWAWRPMFAKEVTVS